MAMCETCFGSGLIETEYSVYRGIGAAGLRGTSIEIPCPDCDGSGQVGCCDGEALPQPMPEKKE